MHLQAGREQAPTIIPPRAALGARAARSARMQSLPHRSIQQEKILGFGFGALRAALVSGAAQARGVAQPFSQATFGLRASVLAIAMAIRKLTTNVPKSTNIDGGTWV